MRAADFGLSPASRQVRLQDNKAWRNVVGQVFHLAKASTLSNQPFTLSSMHTNLHTPPARLHLTGLAWYVNLATRAADSPRVWIENFTWPCSQPGHTWWEILGGCVGGILVFPEAWEKVFSNLHSASQQFGIRFASFADRCSDGWANKVAGSSATALQTGTVTRHQFRRQLGPQFCRPLCK